MLVCHTSFLKSIIKGKSDSPLTECLVVLFGLLEKTQALTDITDMIEREGVVNKVKTMAKVEATLDILRMITFGFCRGTARVGDGILDRDDKPMGGLASLIPSLVTDDEVARFQQNDRTVEGECQDRLSYWWPILLAAPGENAKPKPDNTLRSAINKAINKKGINQALGAKNKTDLTPTGTNELYISTYGIMVEFNQDVFGELLRYDFGSSPDKKELGRRARELAVEFAAVCVETSL